MQLTEHFYLEEASKSDTAARKGIDNSIPLELIPVITKTAVKLEKVRAALGNRPISIDSWYRCPSLNAALGSKSTSQHIKGEAVDFVCPAFGSPTRIAQELMKHKEVIGWDQLILEHTWIHISWNSIPGSAQKGQVLSLLSDGGYATGLTDPRGVGIA